MFEDEINTVVCGDCLEVMKDWPENSIDTIITDPPYGLNFMGKDWDKFGKNKNPAGGNTGRNTPYARNRVAPAFYHYGEEERRAMYSFFYNWASEALRIAKPGAMMLVFGGTRTYHRLACAIEDAGWQIRDCMMWLYGSGFPKSYDVSKGIDKARGVERKQIQINREDMYGKYQKGLTSRAGMGSGKSFGMLQTETDKTDYTRTTIITAPATDPAKLWDGWGTALKPSYESILVAMKPLDGTFAANAEKWGVAGLNVDRGRIGTTEQISFGKTDRKAAGANCYGKYNLRIGNNQHPQGRWPANVILDEEAAALLNQQSGASKSTDRIRHNNQSKFSGKGIYGKFQDKDTYGFADSGGASRFFYCAKASQAERNAGLEGVGKHPSPGVLKMRQDSSLDGKPTAPRQNHHPTVKPLKLMEYLCKLTKTPTGGIVLDSFGGSGSTAVACINTGRDYILIEKDPEYVEIAKHRIEWAKKQKQGQVGLFE